MAKGEILGLMPCPECGEGDAQIKRAKSGLLYRWCAKGCNAQFFARSEDQEYAMRKHLFPSPVTVSVPAPGIEATKPKPEPIPEEKPAAPAAVKPAAQKRGFSMTDLLGVPK